MHTMGYTLIFHQKRDKSAVFLFKDETNCWPVMAARVRQTCCSYGFAEDSLSSLVH